MQIALKKSKNFKRDLINFTSRYQQFPKVLKPSKGHRQRPHDLPHFDIELLKGHHQLGKYILNDFYFEKCQMLKNKEILFYSSNLCDFYLIRTYFISYLTSSYMKNRWRRTETWRKSQQLIDYCFFSRSFIGSACSRNNPIEDDLVLKVGNRGRNRGEFTNPQGVAMSPDGNLGWPLKVNISIY